MDEGIKEKTRKTFNPFAGPTLVRVIPITKPQSEIWTACKFGGEDANRSYNDSVSLFLKGNLNSVYLEKALKQIIERHESLRATFSANGLYMNVFEDLKVSVTYKDVSKLNTEKKDHEVANYLAEDINFVFDLIKGPLYRIGLIKLNDFEHQLILTTHHIICDGWSTGIILEELGALYTGYINNVPTTLPKAEYFSEYADELQDFIKSAQYSITENFWLDQYSDTIPQVSLPVDFPRPRLRTFKSTRQDFLLDNELLTSLKKVGVKAGCSLVTTLISAFEIFLYQQTGQSDIVLGLPSANQSFSGKNQLIGHCVNLLPLRSKLSVSTSFKDYLQQRKSYLFDAYEHQSISFGQLLQKMPIERDPSRVPLVPVMFNVDMAMTSEVSFANLTYELKTNPREFEAFELFLNATGTDDNLLFEWSYNVNLFKPDTIKKMMQSFVEILHKIVQNPAHTLGDIIKVEDISYRQLNNTKTPYSDLAFHDLFVSQAKKTSKNIALEYGDQRISYGHLQEKINALAHQLVEQGVGEGDVVGVSLPRSEKLVVTLLAIMQCGAAYLPLDPNFPSKRLNFMLEDSEAPFLITTKKILQKIDCQCKVLLQEVLFSKLGDYPIRPLALKVEQTSDVYLLYTSGSTGQPKGVPITHKNLINFLTSMAVEPGIKEQDRWLSITTISFDIAGLELFLPLMVGATLVLTDDETVKDTRLLLNILQTKNITILQATPTTWQMLLDAGWTIPLPIKALSGGEPLPLVLAKKIISQTEELWNMYGPTETTIWSTIKKISASDELITVGRPIANTELYILNENGLPTKQGGIGEIAIGGDGVAKGYWKREALTQEKFMVNTALNKRLYSTGDLGKLLDNGEVQCLGRKDQQVKIRGHRIELEEIEEVLNGIKDIHSAIVLVKNNNLIAHVILHNDTVKDKNNYHDWIEVMRQQLPNYMVPQQFEIVSKFPTTLNGKIDRKALATNSNNLGQLKDSLTFANTNEKIVADIWAECLNISQVKPNDNFFELGGHSMIAIKVMTLLEKRTKKSLPLASLLEHSTVKELASLLNEEKPSSSLNSLIPLQPKGTKTPLFIVHGANYNVLVFEKLAKCLDANQPVYGLQAKGIDGNVQPDDTVEAMAANFIAEMKTIYPEGPFAIAGFSFGGIIAYEMHRQLKAEKKQITVLAMFDSYVYPNYYHSDPTKKKRLYQLYKLGQLSFVFFNMFSSPKNFKRRINLLKLAFNGLYLKFKYGKEEQVKRQFNRSTNIDKMHSDAFFKYTIAPQPVTIDLFRASENVYFAHDFKYLGWKKLATKGIRKHKVPGNHNDMFLFPNVEVFAKLLQDTLDKNGFQ